MLPSGFFEFGIEELFALRECLDVFAKTSEEI